MPDPAALIPSIAIAVLLVFMLWFAFGTQRNIRKGNDLLRWLQGGLRLLGRRTTLRWLGSSAVELQLSEPEHPFREMTIVVVLEPRDVGWLWALARRRGRRDFLIFRGSLRRPPREAIEVRDVRGWTGREGPRAGDEEDWRPLAWADGDVSAISSPEADSARARELWRTLGRDSGGAWRLSIRRTVPHLEVHVLPPDLGRVKSEPLLRTIQAIGVAFGREETRH